MIDEENSAIRARVAGILKMHVTAKAVSDDAVREIIRWANRASSPQPIETAPHTDGWILGYDPKLGEKRFMPWIAMTWCDSGWRDDDGNTREPTLWTPLPDPQPAPTGWRPPEGTIRISELSPDGWTSNGKPVTVTWRWMIDIQRGDGSYDEYRDCDFRNTLEEAEQAALKWQEKYGLPIVRVPLDDKIIPFRPRSTVQ